MAVIRRIALDFDHAEHDPVCPQASGAGSQTRYRNRAVLGPFQAVIDQLADDEDAPPSSGIPQLQSFAASVTSTDTTAVTARCGAISASTTARTVRPSSPWGISPAIVLEATSVTFTSTSPTVGGKSPSSSPLGLLERSLRDRPAVRRRSDPPRHGRRLEFLAPLPRRSGGTTPKRSHAGPQRANVSSTRDTPRWPVTTSSTPLLHAARGNEKPDAEGTVKAVQRRFATPVPSGRSRRVEPVFPQVLRGRA